MYKHIIFDLDGTIADTLPIAMEAYNTIARNQNLKIVEEKDIETYRSMTLLDMVSSTGAPKWKWGIYALWYKFLVYKKMHRVNLCKEIVPLFSYLENTDSKLHLVTSNSFFATRDFLQKQEIRDKFTFVQTDVHSMGKASFLNKFIKRKLKADFTSCVYIGDEVRDLQACKAIGLDCISVDWGFNESTYLAKNGAKKIASNAAEVIAFLEE